MCLSGTCGTRVLLRACGYSVRLALTYSCSRVSSALVFHIAHTEQLCKCFMRTHTARGMRIASELRCVFAHDGLYAYHCIHDKRFTTPMNRSVLTILQPSTQVQFQVQLQAQVQVQANAMSTSKSKSKSKPKPKPNYKFELHML